VWSSEGGGDGQVQRQRRGSAERAARATWAGAAGLGAAAQRASAAGSGSGRCRRQRHRRVRQRQAAGVPWAQARAQRAESGARAAQEQSCSTAERLAGAAAWRHALQLRREERASAAWADEERSTALAASGCCGGCDAAAKALNWPRLRRLINKACACSRRGRSVSVAVRRQHRRRRRLSSASQSLASGQSVQAPGLSSAMRGAPSRQREATHRHPSMLVDARDEEAEVRGGRESEAARACDRAARGRDSGVWKRGRWWWEVRAQRCREEEREGQLGPMRAHGLAMPPLLGSRRRQRPEARLPSSLLFVAPSPVQAPPLSGWPRRPSTALLPSCSHELAIRRSSASRRCVSDRGASCIGRRERALRALCGSQGCLQAPEPGTWPQRQHSSPLGAPARRIRSADVEAPLRPQAHSSS
jgi:hypothetical protein